MGDCPAEGGMAGWRRRYRQDRARAGVSAAGAVRLYGDRGCGYGTGVGAAAAAGGVHGFPAGLTSFIGRAGPVREVAGLLDEHRLVTVTGPGGVGKTRLASEVARRVAGRFADGAQVPGVVAAALGVRDQPGVPVGEVLARVLARQQLLVVLDNCEHVIGAAAQLCAALLAGCDDLRVLATSREPLAVAGEARYRLGPLALPAPGGPAQGAGAEAVAFFAARLAGDDADGALAGAPGDPGDGLGVCPSCPTGLYYDK